MPIYEYACDKCGYKFELLKSKMVKNSRETCPSCGGHAKQQLSSFGVSVTGGSSPCAEAAQTGGCPNSRSCASGGCPFSGM